MFFLTRELLLPPMEGQILPGNVSRAQILFLVLPQLSSDIDFDSHSWAVDLKLTSKQNKYVMVQIG